MCVRNHASHHLGQAGHVRIRRVGASDAMVEKSLGTGRERVLGEDDRDSELPWS